MNLKHDQPYFYGRRTFSRILTLQYLYKLDIIPGFNNTEITMGDASSILNQIQIDGFSDSISNYEIEDIQYANELLNGVNNQKNTIDSIIEIFATSFPLKDLPIIDKNILRISIYEIKYVSLKVEIALNEAIEIEPNDVRFYISRGTFKEHENCEDAVEDYTKAIEIDPNYHFAYFNRARVKSELGDYQGAIDDYSKIIEINPI